MRNLLFASAVLLAGCSDANGPESADGTGNEAPVIEVENEAGSAGNGAESSTNEAISAGNGVTVAAAIPTAIRGRWGLVHADCTSTRGDAKGLIEVSDKQIKFYESRANIARIHSEEPTRIDADFAFSGEGQTWERRMTLDAQNDGKMLIRSELGSDAMPTPLRYERCAA